jgi:hypothetical protein
METTREAREGGEEMEGKGHPVIRQAAHQTSSTG